MVQVILSCVRSEEDEYGVEGDANLFQEATDWLRAHPRHGLVEVGFHQPSEGAERKVGARLILYVEPL